jgi:ketosteroid isomerase-like protein
MRINDPVVVADVRAAFDRYERALLSNDNDTLLAMFLDDPATVRYGLAEVQHGFAEIAAFRKGQAPLERQLAQTVVTAYGSDCATVSTLFYRSDLPGQVGRQMQTWIKMPDGWRVVAAHVSMMKEPA